MNDVHLENHVIVHKIGQRILVRHDTAHFGGRQEHVLGFLCGKEGFHLLLTAKIQLFVRTGNDVRISLTLQFAHDSTSYHAAVTCYIYF